MKFSDLMGKGADAPPAAIGTDLDAGADAAVRDADPEAAATPPSPVELSGNRSELDAVLGELETYASGAASDPAENVSADTRMPPAEPAPPIADVMAELAPSADAVATMTVSADPDAWLHGLTVVDDDLLPS